MPEPEPLAPLLAALRDLVVWLQAEHVPGVVIGGVAASLLGRPRATRDIDAMVLLAEDSWERFLLSGARFGFVPRRLDTLAFARQTRVLLVHHEPSGIDADIVFGRLPFEEEAIARVVSVDLGGVSVPLATPEDLIIMKAVAHRPRDLADIESLLDAHAHLDLRRVRRWVRKFSDALDMPGLFNDLEIILSRPRKRKR